VYSSLVDRIKSHAVYNGTIREELSIPTFTCFERDEMRVACYGLAERDAGSVASANFLLLEELVSRGHEIDFYAKSDYVRPQGLLQYSNFHYKGVLLENSSAVRSALPRFVGDGLHRIADEWLHARHLKAIGKLARNSHREAPYDAMLFLGVEPQFDTGSIPTVSWPQGPPQTEWKAIRRLKNQIITHAGRLLYWKLCAYYAYRQRVQRRDLQRANDVISVSEWSRQYIKEAGVPDQHTHVIPYPFDLNLFDPDNDAAPLHPGRSTFLWLGRIDPRKRLDLMLDAFKYLVQCRQDVHLEVVGRLNYAPGYKKLIDNFPYPSHLTYREHVPRAEVPPLMNAVDVLVQPSENENFGSSVAEALCCGTPVILGPTNGTAEFCGDAAFQFDTYRPEALYQQMKLSLEVLDHSDSDLSTLARQTAEKHFDPKHVVSQLEAVLQKFASERATPS